MNYDDVKIVVNEKLDDFYRRRIEKIKSLKLRQTLSRKNPYLFKAIGVTSSKEIVREILTAYMSSSDEGTFGDSFFESIAKFVSDSSGGAEGIDLMKETEDTKKLIAVKSGTNVFNSSSRKKQVDHFNKQKKIEANRKDRRLFIDAIVGYGYGRKETPTNSEGYREIAGQVFWEELTGDADFYLKIIDFISDKPKEHLPLYQEAFEEAVSRFADEFEKDFCYSNGEINWEKLVNFNSGKPCKKITVLNPKSTKKTLSNDETLQLEVSVTLSNDEEVMMTGTTDVTYETDDENALIITEDGIVKFSEAVEPGKEVKVIISCYGKSNTRTFRSGSNSSRKMRVAEKSEEYTF